MNQKQVKQITKDYLAHIVKYAEKTIENEIKQLPEDISYEEAYENLRKSLVKKGLETAIGLIEVKTENLKTFDVYTHNFCKRVQADCLSDVPTVFEKQYGSNCIVKIVKVR